MNARIWKLIALLAVVVTVTSLVPGAPAARAANPTPLEEALAGKYKGTIVAMGGEWGGHWETDYNSTLKSFTDKTGIAVSFVNVEGSPTLAGDIEAGKGPDVVDFSGLGPLRDLARAGKVVDIHKFIDRDTLRQRYNDPVWLDWATVDGPNGPIVAGVWGAVYVHSLVWYPKAAFDRAGYQVPTTWAELLALSDRIVKDGGAPWCIENGLQYGGGRGFPASFWISDLMLRTSPPADYYKWIKGEVKFSSPQVKRAVEVMSALWFKPGYAYGGRPTLNTTYQSDVGRLLLEDPTQCWMMKEPTWMIDYDGVHEDWENPTPLRQKEYGKDYAFFVLPPIDKAYGAPVQVEAHIIGMFHDRPEVRALMDYFSTGAQTRDWVQLDHFELLSPFKDAGPDGYTNPRRRAEAAVVEAARKAGNLHIIAGGMMWPAVTLQSFDSLSAYVDGKLDLDAALKQIDAVWPAEK